MIPKFILPCVVRSDSAGDGHYGASRGSRVHTGVDYVCSPDSPVYSPVDGEVTKLGYPYGDDLTWRYVQITDRTGHRHRLFYVNPLVAVGEQVSKGEEIGEAQNISLRYPNHQKPMTPHVHYEIITPDNEFTNPEEFG